MIEHTFASVRPICQTTQPGELRPEVAPLLRFQAIRDALEQGDSRTASLHLAEAKALEEWAFCGVSSWTRWCDAIPLSRMHAHRLIARLDLES